jgi:hypothetical protein
MKRKYGVAETQQDLAALFTQPPNQPKIITTESSLGHLQAPEKQLF